jgi:hypothetical protein
MSQVRAVLSEKVAVFLDPLERRSGIFAAKGSALARASDTHRPEIKIGAIEWAACALSARVQVRVRGR